MQCLQTGHCVLAGETWSLNTGNNSYDKNSLMFGTFDVLHMDPTIPFVIAAKFFLKRKVERAGISQGSLFLFVYSHHRDFPLPAHSPVWRDWRGPVWERSERGSKPGDGRQLKEWEYWLAECSELWSGESCVTATAVSRCRLVSISDHLPTLCFHSLSYHNWYLLQRLSFIFTLRETKVYLEQQEYMKYSKQAFVSGYKLFY